MNTLTANSFIFPIAGAALGAAVGLTVTKCADRIAAVKCKKAGKPAPSRSCTDNKSIIAAVTADMLICAFAFAYLTPVSLPAAFLIIQTALVCVFVDMNIRVIANETVVLMLALGILYRVSSEGVRSLIGSLAALGLVTALFGGAAAVSSAVRGSPGIGAGDLKYAMALAVTVGWPGALYMLLVFAAAVVVYVLIGFKAKALTMKTYFPMCLHLSLGLLGGMFIPLLCRV